MAQLKTCVNVVVIVPWWSSFYLGLLKIAARCGYPINTDKVARRIADHCKYEIS